MDQQSMLQDMNPSRRPKPPSENQPAPPPQKCPRCDSLNTKFCYYNNYSLSQPRYFCKGCRRYWTHGGTLRNVPVGGGCRKGKRARSSPSPSVSSPSLQQPPPPPLIPNFEQTQRIPSSSSSTSSSPSAYFPSGGFLSSLAAMNMRSLSPLMMTQPQIPPHHHHHIGVGGGQGFNTTNIIPNLPQNQHHHQPPPINDNFSQILANERDPSNMFVHQQPPPQNRGLVPPWALSNHPIGNPSFWNSSNRNPGSNNNNTSLTPNQWLNLPGCGTGTGSAPEIDKKP